MGTILPPIKLESGCRVRDSSGILFCLQKAKKVERIARPVGKRPKKIRAIVSLVCVALIQRILCWALLNNV